MTPYFNYQILVLRTYDLFLLYHYFDNRKEKNVQKFARNLFTIKKEQSPACIWVNTSWQLLLLKFTLLAILILLGDDHLTENRLGVETYT